MQPLHRTLGALLLGVMWLWHVVCYVANACGDIVALAYDEHCV